MRSLQARLGVGVVASVVALFGAQWLVMNDSLRTLTETYFMARLQHDMDGVLAALQFAPDGQPELNNNPLDSLFHKPFSGHYYQLLAGDAVLRSRSLWDRDLHIQAAPLGSRHIFHTRGPQGQSLIVLLAAFEKYGHPVTIAVAEDYSPIADQFRSFQWRYVLISVVALLGLIGVQMLLVRLSLRPLEQMRRNVGRLEQGEITHLVGNVPSEVAPLVDELNHLIAVLGQRLERSRNALGNLAHALKTPLTVINQLLHSDELAQYPELREQLRAQSDAIGRLIQRELKRARLAGAVTPGRRFNPEQEIPPLLVMFEQIYRDKTLDVMGRVPRGLRSGAEREDMLELFGNLLDNACKWAAHKVVLTMEDGADLVATVEDDGPGVDTELLPQLVERGVRADESVNGHGLGLAIAQEIVAHYGGEITFSRSETLGGFKVRVRLPAQRR